MKRITVIIIVLAVLAGAGFFVSKIIARVNQKKIADRTKQTIPAFAFKGLDSSIITNRVIEPGKTTMFLAFNPGCDHCEYEAKEIHTYKEKFAGTRVIMISSRDPEQIREFVQQYKLAELPFVTVAHDADGSFYKLFGTQIVPSIFIYDRAGRLKKEYLGETRMEVIIKQINEGNVGE